MADDVNTLGDWIEQNVNTPGVKGSPEWVQKTEQYRQLRQAEKAAALPDAEAELRASRAASPGGFDATMNRMFTGAATGLPDIGIGIYNAGARALGYPGAQAGYLGPKMIEAGGGGQMPPDASTARQLLEGGGSALLGGGLGAVKAAIASAPSWLGSILPAAGALATTTAAPTIASHYGGAAGGAIAEKLGLDPETGALLGSLLGGAGGAAAPGAVSRYSHERFAGQARPGAPEIAAAAERQGVTPTAGMLGNQDVQLRERQLGNSPGAMGYINDRRQSARDMIGAALDRAAAARGSTDPAPTPGTIGERIATAAGETAQALRDRSEAGQMRLQGRVGAATPVEVAPVREAGLNMMTDPAAGLSVPGRQAVDYRVTDQLAPLVNRDVAGQPILQGGSETVPYGPFRGWRTDLGRSLDTSTGGRMPPTAELYQPATEAMRITAERQGVPRQDFENVQGRTRAVEREGGDYQALQEFANREPASAFNYLKGGEQNPARPGLLEATQHPEVPGIFGDYLRLLGNQTINQQGARGPANLAGAIERMHPEARATIAGPQLPAVNDIAALARSFDYPTSQTGLGRTTGPVAEGAVRLAAGSEALGQLGGMTGIPGAGPAGRLAGLAVMPAIRAIQARIQQGPTAINAMGGGAAPPVMRINDLVAAIDAANAAQQQQYGGPRRGLPR